MARTGQTTALASGKGKNKGKRASPPSKKSTRKFKGIDKNVWLWGRPGKDATTVKVELIVSKHYWTEFCRLMGNDKVVSGVISSLVHEKLDTWLGRYAAVGEPHVLNELVLAAAKSHNRAKGD